MITPGASINSPKTIGEKKMQPRAKVPRRIAYCLPQDLQNKVSKSYGLRNAGTYLKSFENSCLSAPLVKLDIVPLRAIFAPDRIDFTGYSELMYPLSDRNLRDLLFT